MARFVDPLEFYAQEYTRATGVAVTKDDITVLAVMTVPNFYPIAMRSKNAIAKIIHEKLPVNIFYDRVDIANYVRPTDLPSIILPYNADGSVRQLVPKLNEMLGTNFLPEEVDDERYEINAALTKITFRLNDSCRLFKPYDLVVNVGGTYEVVDGEVLHKPFPIGRGPDMYEDNHNAEVGAGASLGHPTIMTARFDYTPIAPILRSVHAFNVDNGNLFKIGDRAGFTGMIVAAIKSVDGQDWTVDTTARAYNLYYALPFYNGPTAGARAFNAGRTNIPWGDMAMLDLVDETFDNVLLMRIPKSVYNKSFPQMAAFHYNNSVKKGRLNEDPA